jgi:cephalosporin-C deacetylase-like acetyl esterase
MNTYDYENSDIQYNVNLLETNHQWRRYSVDFPTAHPTRYEKNNTVRGEYYRPAGIAKAPLAILVHGMGDYGAVPCKFLARSLVKRGVACFVLYQVFHSSRLPESLKNRIYDLSSEEWFEYYQISVVDIRQVIDWAEQVPEIDDGQIAAIGISYGGFISSIAMGIEERIKAGVFLVMGGNSTKMVWKGNRRYMRRWNIYSEADYYQIQNEYREYLTNIADKGIDNITPFRQSFLTDPMTYAHMLRQRPVLMINALWDGAVPKETTLDFWEECGRPEITWFPAGHPTLWLWYPLIIRRIAGFLDKAFAGTGQS